MEKELLNEVVKIFDSCEKFLSFWELATQKDVIKEHLSKPIKPLLDKYFKENKVDGWSYTECGTPYIDACWYLKEFGKGSLAIRLGFFFQIRLLEEDLLKFNRNKISELLKNDEYSPLFDAFERRDFEEKYGCHIIEVGNYYFGDQNDGRFNEEQSAWFATYETQKMAEQIIAKIERFRKNEVVTNLLRKLNEESMIKSSF